MSLVDRYPPCQPAGDRRRAVPARGVEHPWIPSTSTVLATDKSPSFGAVWSASKLHTSGVSTNSPLPARGGSGNQVATAGNGHEPTPERSRRFLDRPGDRGEFPTRSGAWRSLRLADATAKASQAFDGITSVRSETGGTSRSRQSPPRLAPSLRGRPGKSGGYGWNPHVSRIRSTLTGRSGPFLQGQLTTEFGPRTPRIPGSGSARPSIPRTSGARGTGTGAAVKRCKIY